MIDFEQSEQVGALAAALAKAQAALKPLVTDSENPHFRSSYASLAACCKAALPALNAHGLTVVQMPGGDGEIVSVTTQLMHESGEWVRGTLALRPSKSDPQGAGSALTYARRYSLLALVGLAPEDDDANEASAGPPPAREAPKQSAPPKRSKPGAKRGGKSPSKPMPARFPSKEPCPTCGYTVEKGEQMVFTNANPLNEKEVAHAKCFLQEAPFPMGGEEPPPPAEPYGPVDEDDAVPF